LVGALLFLVGDYAHGVERLDRAFYLGNIVAVGTFIGATVALPYLALAINCFLRERREKEIRPAEDGRRVPGSSEGCGQR
jgi:hypothetical protein